MKKLILSFIDKRNSDIGSEQLLSVIVTSCFGLGQMFAWSTWSIGHYVISLLLFLYLKLKSILWEPLGKNS